MLLVLPERDSLAVQSDVWVDKMRTAGWDGPVRFGDGREGDWDGHGRGRGEDDEGEASSATAPGSKERRPWNGGLEVWHAPGCRHGWTQFPTVALGQHERRERDLIFARALDFVREKWRREVEVEVLGNRSQVLTPLEIPANDEDDVEEEGLAESSRARGS